MVVLLLDIGNCVSSHDDRLKLESPISASSLDCESERNEDQHFMFYLDSTLSKLQRQLTREVFMPGCNFTYIGLLVQDKFKTRVHDVHYHIEHIV